MAPELELLFQELAGEDEELSAPQLQTLLSIALEPGEGEGAPPWWGLERAKRPSCSVAAGSLCTVLFLRSQSSQRGPQRDRGQDMRAAAAVFWGTRAGPGKGHVGGLLPCEDTAFNQMPPPQHGHSLALHHFQQLWGHLLVWQVRCGQSRAGTGAPGTRGGRDHPQVTWSAVGGLTERPQGGPVPACSWAAADPRQEALRAPPYSASVH